MANSGNAATPAANTDQPDGKGDSGKSLIQVAFPERANLVFFVAVAVAIIFICLPTVFRSYFAQNSVHSNLIICIGAAIVLAALGGQATVKIGGIVMAGAAGIAIGLFWYLQSNADNLFLRGTIDSFDFDKYRSIDMKHSSTILGSINQGKDIKRSGYDFVIFKREVGSDRIEVALTQRDTGKERVIFIDIGEVEWGFGNQQRVGWELREVDVSGEKILTLFQRFGSKEVGRELADIQPNSRVATGWSLIGAAAAQGDSGRIDLPLLIERLKSEDAATRRGARDALSNAPLDSIPAIMRAFREQFSNYQMRLGICVALAQMLRGDKKKGPAISAQLDHEDRIRLPDRNLLLDAAGDQDRTVRVYATEFLFDLADAQVAKLAISRAADTDNDDARYNWLFVAQGGWLQLSAADRRSLEGPLNKVKDRAGAKTKALAEQFKI